MFDPRHESHSFKKKIKVPDMIEHLCFRIYVHAYTRLDGTGGLTTAEVNASIAKLNSDFSPHNISFQWDNQINSIPIVNSQFENMGGAKIHIPIPMVLTYSFMEMIFQ